MPKLQMGDDAYRIVGDAGEEGELVMYGDAAVLETGGRRYVAVVDVDPEDPDSVVSLLPDDEWLIEGRAVPCEQEDVDFQGPDGGQGGEIDIEADDEEDDEDELDEEDEEGDDEDELDDLEEEEEDPAELNAQHALG